MTDKLPIDDSVTAEYLAWLESNHPRHGLGGNVAWNAGVAFGKSQAVRVREAVPEGFSDAEIWAITRDMSDLFDHPWGSMTLVDRQWIFEKVKEILAGAKEEK